jgi:hypothetical protein
VVARTPTPIDPVLDVVASVQIELLSEIVRAFEKEFNDAVHGCMEPISLPTNPENPGGRGEEAEHEAVVRAIERGSGLARLILFADELRAVLEHRQHGGG